MKTKWNHFEHGIMVVLFVLAMADWGKKLRTVELSGELANALTQLRMLLTPLVALQLVLAYALHSPAFAIMATVAITVVYVTDFLDGLVSRVLKQPSDYGKYWDSLADKVVTWVVVGLLALLGLFWFPPGLPWLANILFWGGCWLSIVVRDISVTAMRNRYLAKHPGGSVAADKTGKYKTAALMVGTVVCVLAFTIQMSFGPSPAAYTMLAVGGALTLIGVVLSAVSWPQYARKYRVAQVRK